MLRLKALIILTLGVLVSCGPSTSEVPQVPANSLERKSSGLVDPSSYTVSLTWSGGASPCANCTGLGKPIGDLCTTDATWNSGMKTFSDPVLNGYQVVRVEVQVGGNCPSVPPENPSPQVTVKLNDREIGKYTLTKTASCSPSCDKYVANSANYPNGFPDYKYGATNTFQLDVPTGVRHCVSYADVKLVVEQRQIAVSPSSVDFGRRKAGIASTEETVLVSAGANNSLTIKGLVLSGGVGSQFSVRTETGEVPPFVINAGTSKKLFVKFTPKSVSTTQVLEQLKIQSDAYQPEVSVALTGYGVTYVNDVLAESGTNLLDFVEEQVGDTSPSKTVTVRNAGATNLKVLDVATTGPFEVTTPPQGKSFTLLPGETSEPIPVVFKPVLPEGAATGTLTIKTDAPTSDLPNAVVNLKGTGVIPKLSVTSEDLDFKQQVVGATPATLSFSVKNAGTGTLKLNIPGSINGTSGKTTFTVSPNGSRNLKSTDAALVITVSFTPPQASSEDTYLTFTDAYGRALVPRVRLRGQGASKLEMDTVGTHDFGNVRPGEVSSIKTIRLTNRSSAPIELSSVAVEPPFHVVSALPLPTTLGTKDSFVSFNVQFKPAERGTFQKPLSVVSDATIPPGALSFKGVGLAPHGVFTLAETPTDPTTLLRFDGVRETESKTLVVRLHNKGNTTLTFLAEPSPSANVYTYSASTPYNQVSIAPDAYHEFRVSFKPEARVNYPGKLTFASNADNPLVLDLSGFGSYSELKVLPDLINFGDVQVGTPSTPSEVTISNLGDAPVNLLNLSVTTPFAIVYRKKPDPADKTGTTLVDDKPPRPISSSNPFKFDVVYKPGAETTDETGSVIIGTDFGPNKTVALQGSGTVPELKVDEPSALDFSNQRLLKPSVAQTLTVRNGGRAPLKIERISATKSVFAISPPPDKSFPLTIGPGGIEFLDVVFTPTTEGKETAQVTFVSDTAKAINKIPTLQGVGVDGKLKVTPNVVNFNDVDVNSSGAAQVSVKLENIGLYPLVIKEVLPPGGDFGIFGLDQNRELPANGGSWTFTATFAPKKQGYVTASAIIKTDAVTNKDFNLAMDGTGIAAAVELQPADYIGFGKANVGANVSANLTIRNPGKKILTVSSVGFVDVVAGTEMALDFSHAEAVPFDVPSMGSVTIPLRFTPSQIGARNAWAVIRSNAANAPEAKVQLRGEGTSPRLELSSSTLDFSKLVVGASATKSFTITNTGTGPFTLTGVQLDGLDKDRFIMAPVPPSITLKPKPATGSSPESSVEITVTFQPNAVKDFSAVVVVTSSDADVKSTTILLTGSGVNDQIEVTNSLYFGQHLVGTKSSSKYVTITNSSNSIITVSDLSVDDSRFSVAKPTLPLNIPPQTSQKIGVTFNPLVEGEVTGHMKVTFSTPSQQRDVELRGKGIPKVLSINTLAEKQDFGTLRIGTNKSGVPIVLTNVSDEVITLAEPTVEYSSGEAFSYDKTLVANQQLSPGQSVSMPVLYAPKEEVLSEVKLNFGTTVPLQSNTVSATLSGSATKSLLQVDKSVLDFDWVDVDDTVSSGDITVVNKSAQQQRVTVAMKGGAPYTLERDAFNNPIPAGGSATFKVVFAPKSPDAFEDEVQVSLQTGEPETTIKVRGNGRSITAGGGGCSCGSTEVGTAGMLAMLALVGLSSRRRRRE